MFPVEEKEAGTPHPYPLAGFLWPYCKLLQKPQSSGLSEYVVI